MKKKFYETPSWQALLCGATFSLLSCTTTVAPSESGVKKTNAKELESPSMDSHSASSYSSSTSGESQSSEDQSRESQSSESQTHEKSKPHEPPSCIGFPDASPEEKPLLIKDAMVMVTKMVETCQTKEGVKGYLPNSSFMAMGIPCSGGQGQFFTSGNDWLPKIVSFSMATSCPMHPQTNDPTQKVRTAMQLGPNSKMLALTPFVTQFWKVEGYKDKGTGFAIELQSMDARQHAWRPFLEGKPIFVRLYGRENSWVGSQHMFEVYGTIKKADGHRRFSFHPIGIKVLTAEEIKKVESQGSL